MRYLLSLLALLFCICVDVKGDDGVPNKAVVRRQINELIAHAPAHRATLGTLIAAFDLSISYGAPEWNAHDHDGCADFYVATGESLCKGFPDAGSASSSARQILDDLKSALDRVKQSGDADANAWTMRYVFDKTEAQISVERDRSARMMSLGLENLARSDFQDAASAFGVSVDSLHELDGQPIEAIPVECRYAPLALSDALLGQKHYKEAAAAVEEGLRYLPGLPDQPVDPRRHFADPAVHRVLCDDLQDAAAKNPDDSALQLLAGYELLFTERREMAKPYLDKALQLNPKDTAAKLMLEQYDPAHPKPVPQGQPPKGNQA